MSDIYKDNVVQTRAIYPTSGFSQYIALLVISKFLHSFGLFIAYDLLNLLHVVQLLFFIKVGSAICFVLLQKPFSNTRKITKQQWVRIWRHAFFNSLINLLWLFGLTLCGPLRTILLSEHADIVVIAGASALFTSNGGTAKVRGAVFFLICVVALLLFDNDNPLTKQLEHPEGFEQQHHGVSHVFYYLISWIGVADHKGGVILLFAVLCLRTGFNSAARKLSVDLGGAKRLNAASTLISAVMLAPWVLAVMYMQVTNVESWLTLFVPITLVTVFGFVFDYYVEAICTARLDANKTAHYGSVAVVVSAFLFSIFWNHPYAKQMKTTGYIFLEDTEDHVLSGGVIFSGVMVIFATSILSSPSTKGTKGSFIGYSSSGQPLYNFSGDALQRTSQSLLLLSKNGLKQILEEPDSRKIFYFLCANLSFTFVELIYGVWTNSLGLISDGFHMLFDCSALVMGLFAALMTRWKATRIFSYGYGRVEVLSGFLNGLFLVVIAFFVFTEAMSRLLDPPQIITERLLTVSLAGLLVNLMGILAFRHAHSHSSQINHHGGGHSHHAHSHVPSHHDGHGHHHEHGSASNANIRGVFLHILADTLGSVGVIVSSLLIENFGWLIADPICSLFIAILIFISVLPLLKESALVLLQRTPAGMEQELGEALQKVLSLEGVLSFQDQHFWQHSTHIIAGTIHVQVMPDASEQKIIAQLTAIFKDCGVDNFTVQVEKEVYFQHMSALSSSFNQIIEVTPIITKGNFLSTANFAAAV